MPLARQLARFPAQVLRRDDGLDRQMVRGALGHERSVRLEREQRRARTHPYAVERKERPARREGTLDHRAAEQAIEPAQRPTEREPLVDVAEHDEPLVRLAHELDQLAQLPAALGGKEPEVRDDDAQARAGDVEVDIERVPRLAAAVAEGDAAYVEHLARR